MLCCCNREEFRKEHDAVGCWVGVGTGIWSSWSQGLCTGCRFSKNMRCLLNWTWLSLSIGSCNNNPVTLSNTNNYCKQLLQPNARVWNARVWNASNNPLDKHCPRQALFLTPSSARLPRSKLVARIGKSCANSHMHSTATLPKPPKSSGSTTRG